MDTLHVNKLHACMIIYTRSNPQLVADNCSISKIPAVIAYCAPCSTKTHFHTTRKRVGAIYQSHVPVSTWSCKWNTSTDHINLCIQVSHKPSTCISYDNNYWLQKNIPEHTAPASFQCWQVWTLSTEQSNSLVSAPPQPTFSKRIGPVPSP